MKTRKRRVTAKRHRKMNPDPPPPVPTEPNLPVQGPTLTPRLKLLLAIAALSILIMAITIAIRYLPNLLNPTQPASIPTLTPSPTPAIKRVEISPENVPPEADYMEFSLPGSPLIRANGKIEKVIDSGKSYSVLLNTGEKITVLIGKITKLGDAWFEVTGTGVLVRRSYDLIDKEEWVKRAQVGSRVNLTFFKDKLTSKKQVEAEELVLND